MITPTGRRLRTGPELHEILQRVRADGHAENHEETAAGLYTASVPVTNEAGRVLAALTMCIPTSRLNEALREHVIADLRDAGTALSTDVAWLPAYNARRH